MFYAVRKGRAAGIFSSWEECRKQTAGFAGAEYKKFENKKDAEIYMAGGLSEQKGGKSADLTGLHAYIDGSYSEKVSRAGYGIVILLDGEITDMIKGSSAKYMDMRNVAGELFAAGLAVMWAIERNFDEITLHYDYAGIACWADGSWKCKREGTINYKSFIDKVSGKIKINFIKVKSHSGDMYNDMADKLAKEALSSEDIP